MVPGDACAPGTPAPRTGQARPTSIRPRSASRSRTPGTSTAIRIFRRSRCRRSPRCAATSPSAAASAAERVLAHSDVAPGRKIDPGEKFDWARLAKHGVGHWVEPAPLDAAFGLPARRCGESQRRKSCCALTATTSRTRGAMTGPRFVIRTFQLHFRPGRADGRLDAGTLDTLRRLVAALPALATS